MEDDEMQLKSDFISFQTKQYFLNEVVLTFFALSELWLLFQ